MRLSFALLPALLSAAALAQTAKIDEAVKAKLATAKWVTALQDPAGGFYAAPRDPKSDAVPQPSLRATSAAVRTLKYLGAEIPNKEKHAAFVLKSFDPMTGSFSEPGGKPDVTITSVGVMAAVELGIPKEKFAKSMDYLKETPKTFEDYRIAAAGVEAWGIKDCPFKLPEWHDTGIKTLSVKLPPIRDGGARLIGSVTAFTIRLGQERPTDSKPEAIARLLDVGLLPDGGWGKEGEKAADIETTYRVMRAFVMLKEKPTEATAVRKFIQSHRNADGGYGLKPGEKSSVGATYYATIITKWLDAMER